MMSFLPARYSSNPKPVFRREWPKFEAIYRLSCSRPLKATPLALSTHRSFCFEDPLRYLSSRKKTWMPADFSQHMHLRQIFCYKNHAQVFLIQAFIFLTFLIRLCKTHCLHCRPCSRYPRSKSLARWCWHTGPAPLPKFISV